MLQGWDLRYDFLVCLGLETGLTTAAAAAAAAAVVDIVVVDDAAEKLGRQGEQTCVALLEWVALSR